MGTQRFDDWTRTIATAQSRRRAVGILLGGMLARIGIGNEPEAEAKDGGKNKHKHKHKKRKKGGGGGKPKPHKCNGASDCNKCQRCSGGECVPDLTRNGEVCAQCATCLKGQCYADPKLEGKACFNGSCKRCKANGECGAPDDKNCAEGQICRPADGRCAPACREDGSPCPVNHICIDDGIFGAPNTCCFVGNDPGQEPPNFGCGRNGDGTFRECCSSHTERCCDDIVGPRCVNKAFCCANETPCGGKCCKEGESCLNQQCVVLCPGGREKCNGVCCQENEVCNINRICEDPTVCPQESCSSVGLKCCPPNRDTNVAYCCNPTDTCTGQFPGCSPN